MVSRVMAAISASTMVKEIEPRMAARPVELGQGGDQVVVELARML